MRGSGGLRRGRPWRAVLVGAGLAALLLARPSQAIFANVGEPVPVERLVRNVGRYVEQNPKDARGHYTLGRIHSLAFAQTSRSVHVISAEAGAVQPAPLPGFPPFHSITEPRPADAGRADERALRHLRASARHYRRATKLAPGEALYWLGLGWMLEQGAPYARQVDAPFLEPPRRAGERQWREQALAAYRRAYSLRREEDIQRQSLGPEADTAISLEAGEGILRIFGKRTPTAAEAREIAPVRETVRKLRILPRAVTPILFPLERPLSLAELLAPGSVVRFDLAGDGRAERWPWVAPETGILVWDPRGTGRIVSGRQCFGSATWSMFWKDGYEPLAALDNDADGWLAGEELQGLAVWQDRDGDGRSDPGEVRPLTAVGVERVAARAAARRDGVPYHPDGIRLRDGTALPTYDWTPTSLPEREPRARR